MQALGYLVGINIRRYIDAMVDLKNTTSERKVWLPKTVAYILREWKKSQDHVKEIRGPEYTDYGLVFAFDGGCPCDTKIIEKAFQRLQEKIHFSKMLFFPHCGTPALHTS